MRPYWAILWDSFYQAVVSWILWIVLGATAIVLLTFGGLTYRDELNTSFTLDDVNDWHAFAARLVEQHNHSGPSPGKHIFALLRTNVQKGTEILARGPSPTLKPLEELTLTDALANELNRLLARDDFFDREAFARVGVSQEGRDLIARDDLAPAESARRNRLLLEGAFADFVKKSPRDAAQFYYLFLKIGGPMPLRNDQIVDTVNSIIYLMLLGFVSTVGIMVAIVLTSWLIPVMFEEGSIVVLVSKPISRSLLFLAKFVGACSFILITTSFFIVGLYLIAGCRFGVWSPNVLWCIPIFLFVFAIYFSVSALCGLMSRNPLVATVLANLGVFVFWFVCFLVGWAKFGMERTFLRPMQLVTLVPEGERLFAVSGAGQIARWDETSRDWKEILVNDKQPFAEVPVLMRPTHGVLGPVYNGPAEQLLALDEPPDGFSFMTRDQTLAVGRPAHDFRYTAGRAAPAGTFALFADRDGRPLFITRNGVQRLSGSAVAANKQESNLLKLVWPFGGEKSAYESLGPEGAFWRDPAAAALDPTTNDLAIYSAGTLSLWRRAADGKYTPGGEVKLAGDPKPGLVAYAGNTILLALSDGSVTSYNATTLAPLTLWEPEGTIKPRAAYAAPGGKWLAVLFQNGNLWCLDTEANEFVRPQLRGQGTISGAAFSASDTLLVADHTTRVTAYEAGAWRRQAENVPAYSLIEWTYYGVIEPAYYCLPKPGELNYTVNYVLRQKPPPTNSRRRPTERDAPAEERDPWAPIGSSALFVVVVLAYGCWKIERMEF